MSGQIHVLPTRKILFVIVGVVLMFSPSFIGKILIEKAKVDIGFVAVGALAMFLIGTYLVLKFARD